MPVDHFPSTHATWIDAQLTIVERAGVHTEHGQSAQYALRQYLMQRYHAALRAYVTRSSLRSLTEPDDLVGGSSLNEHVNLIFSTHGARAGYHFGAG
jgi:hypothetical protein